MLRTWLTDVCVSFICKKNISVVLVESREHKIETKIAKTNHDLGLLHSICIIEMFHCHYNR